MVSFSEKRAVAWPGLPLLFVLLLVGVVTVVAFVTGVESDSAVFLVPSIAGIAFVGLAAVGFFINPPNEAKVLTVFGTYTGTVRESGFWWANPFAQKKKISLKVRNFSGAQIKVNDLHGNPIEIAAVVVWQVTETAKASFDVEDFESFVTVQSETAVRALASEYPYDTQDGEGASLRANPTEVAQLLKSQLQARLELAGVTVLEARLTHLAYAPEIAHAMLRRQQAQAVVAARVKIVEGAVGMVQGALQALAERNIVTLDEERKAVMVNNLLVALVSDKDSQPVINTGTLY